MFKNLWCRGRRNDLGVLSVFPLQSKTNNGTQTDPKVDYFPAEGLFHELQRQGRMLSSGPLESWYPAFIPMFLSIWFLLVQDLPEGDTVNSHEVLNLQQKEITSVPGAQTRCVRLSLIALDGVHVFLKKSPCRTRYCEIYCILGFFSLNTNYIILHICSELTFPSHLTVYLVDVFVGVSACRYNFFSAVAWHSTAHI